MHSSSEPSVAGQMPFALIDTLREEMGPIRILLSEFNCDPHMGDLLAVRYKGWPGKRWFEIVEVGIDDYIILPTSKRPPK